jgi:hypothetical protein
LKIFESCRNKSITSKQIENSRFATTWKYWTDYVKNIYYFHLNFAWKGTLLMALKGNNSCKTFIFYDLLFFSSKVYLCFSSSRNCCYIQRGIQNEQPRDTGNVGHTRHRTKTKKKQTKNTTQKNKKMTNTNPTYDRRWIQMLTKGQQFLLLIRHPPCYSYNHDIENGISILIE